MEKGAGMNIALAVFSNCTNTCLEEPTIYDTVYSLGVALKDAYQINSVRVFVDPNPNPDKYDEYVKKLKDYGFYVVKTKSLADGWVKAMDAAEFEGAEFLFMVEHDWLFDPDNINHTLADITFRMKKDDLSVMLFNKHKNDEALNGTKWQSYFKPVPKRFYCLTDRFSNNPHILNIQKFRDKFFNMVDWDVPGAGQIEQALQKNVEIAVYGNYGNGPAIKHLDGRKGGKK